MNKTRPSEHRTNETLEVLKTRRSIRKFKSDPIPRDVLDRILEAGTYAPTGMGRQSPVIIAITDPEARNRLAWENAAIGGWDEGFDPFYGAPVILLVAARRECPTAVYDGSCVMANLMNAAWALGIGSCWIHRAKEELESGYGQALLRSLEIEGDYIGVGHVALGYIDGKPPAPKPRKEHWVYRVG